MKILLKVDVINLMKTGMSIKEATEKAGKKMQQEISRAEYETYCNEHDC